MENGKDTESKQNTLIGRLFRENWTIILSLVLVIVMLLTVVSPLGLFSAHDAPFQLLAACLGAIVTALITGLLLKSQTKQQHELQQEQAKQQQELQICQNEAQTKLQEQMAKNELLREKETKVYEEKLHIYKEYLKKLCDVVKDRQLSNEEKIELQFQTAYITMHTKEDLHVKEISNSTSEILKLLCSKGSSEVRSKTIAEELQSQLFTLVRCFEEELYGESKEKNDNLRKEAAKIYANAFDSFESEENDVLATPISIPSRINFDELASKLEKACPNWNDDWQIKMQGDGFRIQREGKIGAIEVGFWENHYYIQAEYEGFSDFAKALKRKYGGRRSYGTWWCHITENGFYDIKQGEMLANLTQNESMQETMSNWIDILIKDIDSFEPYANWWQALKDEETIDNYSKWSSWIWADEDTNEFMCLVCDFDNAEFGRPFLDTYKIEEEKRIVIVLWNREDKEEYTTKLLEQLKGEISSSENIEGNRRVLSSLPINDSDDHLVAKEINRIIYCINKV